MDQVIAGHLSTIDQVKFFAEITLRGEIPERARYHQLTPETAHIHWLVGHVAFAIDRIALPGLGGATGLPDAWQPLFGWGTKAAADPTGYPGWDATVAELHETVGRLRAHVASLTMADLSRPLPEGHPFAKRLPECGAIVPFTAGHTCYHLGQISLLRRAQGLPAGTQIKG